MPPPLPPSAPQNSPSSAAAACACVPAQLGSHGGTMPGSFGSSCCCPRPSPAAGARACSRARRRRRQEPRWSQAPVVDPSLMNTRTQSPAWMPSVRESWGGRAGGQGAGGARVSGDAGAPQRSDANPTIPDHHAPPTRPTHPPGWSFQTVAPSRRGAHAQGSSGACRSAAQGRCGATGSTRSGSGGEPRRHREPAEPHVGWQRTQPCRAHATPRQPSHERDEGAGEGPGAVVAGCRWARRLRFWGGDAPAATCPAGHAPPPPPAPHLTPPPHPPPACVMVRGPSTSVREAGM